MAGQTAISRATDPQLLIDNLACIFLQIVVWKRYNDFKKLNKALSLLHYNLRRPEKFPVFAKAKFFGNY